ncbi:hypothetical protein [Actinoplanes couchii]|uniref:Uncharacterized protein n=1 Tax=Actinoplanes couchii TaxID=403638 RepID=A0ABQ3XPU8_9ACTN|nr:hypothetical protein [Actinoplanes couchii]MDR6319172.1 hypothetical protein [Actinoplanes couchii]GID60513.1 hypothetical protein Aco03nite_089170 [Actinoplanes couchii]
MEYIEAAETVSDHLGAGGDELAPPGAVHLILTAWEQLAPADRVWDRVSSVLLDVRGRLYGDQEVTVVAEPPQDGPGTRAAVMGLLAALARHHQDLAAGEGPLASLLDHDAAAQQLRAVAAVLR